MEISIQKHLSPLLFFHTYNRKEKGEIKNMSKKRCKNTKKRYVLVLARPAGKVTRCKTYVKIIYVIVAVSMTMLTPTETYDFIMMLQPCLQCMCAFFDLLSKMSDVYIFCQNVMCRSRISRK